MMRLGTPKREIQLFTNISTTVSAFIFRIGNASGHRVFLSIIVSRYVYPREGGSGPTISMWTVSNRLPVGNDNKGGLVLRVILLD